MAARRGAGWPTSRSAVPGVTGASAEVTSSRRRPRTSSPYPTVRSPPDSRMQPSSAASPAVPICQRAAASPTRHSRAEAAVWRRCSAASGIDRLPNVPASNGQTSVSPITSRTASRGTRSSSATRRESAVLLSCPTSTLPVNAVTSPSAPTWSQAPVLVDQPPGDGCPRRAGPGWRTTTSPSGSRSK